MPSPEFPINIKLKESNSVRKAAGSGSENIGPEFAQLLLGQPGLNAQFEMNLFYSQYQELFQAMAVKWADGEKVDLALLSPVQNAAFQVDATARWLKLQGVDQSLNLVQSYPDIPMGREVPVVVFNDIGVGMQLVSDIANQMEGIMEFHRIEGIPPEDTAVHAFLEEYAQDPVRVIGESVAAHTARYVRGSEEVGLYVPEFVIAGAQHGHNLFANIHQALTTS